MGFYVEPLSVKHAYNGEWSGKEPAPVLTTCSQQKHLTYEDVKGGHQKLQFGKIIFTYGVEWRSSDVRQYF